MTLPLFLVDPALLGQVAPGSPLVLGGAEGRHAATVRRIGTDEEILLGDGAGRRVRCRVVSAAPAQLDLTVLDVRDEAPPQPRLVLVQALAKNDRDDQAIEAATELGVDEVVPWQAARSIVQWRGERGTKAWRKWQSALVAASKQSRRSRVPDLAALVDTAGLVRRAQKAALALVLHEDATEPLAAVQLPSEGDVLLVVGPEGGISPDEVDRLREVGGRAVRLGSTVLRSSSAGPAALAVLSAQQRWR